ncbi:unnamed protein product [Clavelina lepadiformis]
MKNFMPRDAVYKIEHLTNVVSQLGKSRAWLYITLNDGFLESVLASAKQNLDMILPYYCTWSHVSSSTNELIQSLLCGLECISFSLDINQRHLDIAVVHPKFLQTTNGIPGIPQKPKSNKGSSVYIGTESLTSSSKMVTQSLHKLWQNASSLVSIKEDKVENKSVPLKEFKTYANIHVNKGELPLSNPTLVENGNVSHEFREADDMQLGASLSVSHTKDVIVAKSTNANQSGRKCTPIFNSSMHSINEDNVSLATRLNPFDIDHSVYEKPWEGVAMQYSTSSLRRHDLHVLVVDTPIEVVHKNFRKKCSISKGRHISTASSSTSSENTCVAPSVSSVSPKLRGSSLLYEHSGNKEVLPVICKRNGSLISTSPELSLPLTISPNFSDPLCNSKVIPLTNNRGQADNSNEANYCNMASSTATDESISAAKLSCKIEMTQSNSLLKSSCITAVDKGKICQERGNVNLSTRKAFDQCRDSVDYQLTTAVGEATTSEANNELFLEQCSLFPITDTVQHTLETQKMVSGDLSSIKIESNSIEDLQERSSFMSLSTQSSSLSSDAVHSLTGVYTGSLMLEKSNNKPATNSTHYLLDSDFISEPHCDSIYDLKSPGQNEKIGDDSPSLPRVSHRQNENDISPTTSRSLSSDAVDSELFDSHPLTHLNHLNEADGDSNDNFVIVSAPQCSMNELNEDKSQIDKKASILKLDNNLRLHFMLEIMESEDESMLLAAKIPFQQMALLITDEYVYFMRYSKDVYRRETHVSYSDMNVDLLFGKQGFTISTGSSQSQHCYTADSGLTQNIIDAALKGFNTYHKKKDMAFKLVIDCSKHEDLLKRLIAMKLGISYIDCNITMHFVVNWKGAIPGGISGYLKRKEGKLFQKWVEVYCVVEDGIFYQYSSKTSVKPDCCLFLQNCLHCTLRNSTDFRLVLHNSHFIEFRARDDDVTKWLDTIRASISQQVDHRSFSSLVVSHRHIFVVTQQVVAEASVDSIVKFETETKCSVCYVTVRRHGKKDRWIVGFADTNQLKEFQKFIEGSCQLP